jgi:hypothetical protein
MHDDNNTTRPQTVEDRIAQNLQARNERLALSCIVERSPHFRAPVGAAGTVVDAGEHVISLHMAEHLPGTEAWDNEIVWTEDDDYNETGTPASNPSVAAAFYRRAVALTEPAIPTEVQTPAQANAEAFEREPQRRDAAWSRARVTDRHDHARDPLIQRTVNPPRLLGTERQITRGPSWMVSSIWPRRRPARLRLSFVRLRSGCGPFSLPLRSICGLQTNEQPRTPANTVPRGPAFSGIFAHVR